MQNAFVGLLNLAGPVLQGCFEKRDYLGRALTRIDQGAPGPQAAEIGQPVQQVQVSLANQAQASRTRKEPGLQ
jgi:hypothetical protein